MKFARVFLVVLALGSLPSQAADEERMREARALFKSMQTDQQIDAMASSMGQVMAREFSTPGADTKVSQVVMSETMAVMMERFKRPGGTLDAALEAYAEVFTAEELRAARAFYESPVGQKLQAKTPELMMVLMQKVMRESKEDLPKVCERIKARLAAEGLESNSFKTCPMPGAK